MNSLNKSVAIPSFPDESFTKTNDVTHFISPQVLEGFLNLLRHGSDLRTLWLRVSYLSTLEFCVCTMLPMCFGQILGDIHKPRGQLKGRGRHIARGHS